MEYPNGNQNFYLPARDSRSFNSDVGENETKQNNIKNIGTKRLDFHEGRDRVKEHFVFLFIGLFCLCAHLTITMHEHLFCTRPFDGI